MQDNIRLPDGRVLVHTTVGHDNGGPGTGVWVGDSITDLSFIGMLQYPDGTHITDDDCGSFLDSRGLIHIYPEGEEYPGEPCSDYINHYTTTLDDLLTVTEHGTVIDTSDRVWHTGDPDIIQMAGDYYMFMDRAPTHPNYSQAVARSVDLYDWEITQDIICREGGGDLALTWYGGELRGLTEFSGNDNDGIGAWKLTPEVVASSVAEFRQQEFRDSAQKLVLHANSLNEVFIDTTGSGSVDLSGGGPPTNAFALRSGTTADSKAKFIRDYKTGFESDIWTTNRTFAADVDYLSVVDGSFVGSGAYGVDAQSNKHIGFRVINGDLVGSVGDGSANATTVLRSGFGGGKVSLRIEYTYGQRAEYYVDGVLEGTITASDPLPSGSSADNRLLVVIAHNGSATSDSQIDVHRIGAVID